MKIAARLVTLLGLIALAEFLIMVSLPLLGVHEGFLKDVLDTSLLVVIIAPFIYLSIRSEKKAERQRKQFEGALAEQARHAALGADVGAALTKGTTLCGALQGCADAMVSRLGAAFARIWTLNEAEGMLELQASAGMYTHIDGPHCCVPVGKYKIGLIAQEKKPHLTNAVVGDPRVHDQQWAREKGMVAFAGHPLIVEDKVVGVMAMFSKKPLSEATMTALGSVANVIAIGIERKNMEVHLKGSEARFRSLVEESLAGAYIIQDGRFAYCNKRFAEIYGYATKGEVRDLSEALELVHPDDRPFVHEILKGRAAGEPANIQYQVRGLKKDGSVINVEVIGWSAEYNGRPAAIGTAIDITRRRQAEEERSALYSMLTHDIKGPLSIIMGYGDLLYEAETDKEHASMVEEIRKSARRISLLINDMLDLSRIESGAAPIKLEPVSMPDLIREAAADIEMPVAEMDLSVTVDVADNLPQVHADKAQLTRALYNLMANAVNYNKQGGSITVRCGAVDDAGGRVFVEVVDTGIGIAEEDLPHIFTKYYRCAKSRHKKGTGLGLAIVKAVADAHGGEVSAVSREGEGSTFRMVLPTGHSGPG